MNLFEYSDPELVRFYKLGSFAVNLDTLEVERTAFSLYETSTGSEKLDYPFDANTVTLRPGLWYALNLSLGGNKKSQIINFTNNLRENVKKQFGEFEISFVIILSPGAMIPPHRHFRDFNTVSFCVPAKDNVVGLDIEVNGKLHNLKKGYINFDSKQTHSAKNMSDTTYWIFVFENVQSSNNPQIELKEL